MGGDEVIVEKGVSQFGLYRMHVMRMGAEVDLEYWVEEVTAAGGVVETFYRYKEEDLDVWHLRLYWRMPGEVVPDHNWCRCVVVEVQE